MFCFLRFVYTFTLESVEDHEERKMKRKTQKWVFEQSYFTGSHPSKF